MPPVSGSDREYAAVCFPPASPVSPLEAGKQKTVPKDYFNRPIFQGKSGAGDGIRTHDPNLGKVPHDFR